MSFTFNCAQSKQARVRRLLELNVVGVQTMLSFLVCALMCGGELRAMMMRCNYGTPALPIDYRRINPVMNSVDGPASSAFGA
jgi:hypothetical protein